MTLRADVTEAPDGVPVATYTWLPPERAARAVVQIAHGAAEHALRYDRFARFLARRGPGIHHVCYRVADLDAALAACRAEGYTLIDERPRTGAGGCRIAFVHPKATDGILIELTEGAATS